ncbi:VOC family protein [Luteimonas sp. RD2P54]|uniref:VOC family protein n=1 Tax=Luteimonas endophytica TaxID=3042023 RepID=A0ABT6J4H3_9GAMM|nr:VOC family protein [Luteimonas endophytica]MDH5821727.1 VOC family protein [Luteimonas endophytica]
MNFGITVLTLGVRDLESAVRFYREGLGLSTEGIVGTEIEFGAVAFFDVQPGLKLALWPLASIAHDTGRPAPDRFTGAMTIGFNVDSKHAVDVAFEQAGAAGATPLKRPAETFYGGYAGYFLDPDGHVWEVVYNPDFDQIGA